MTAISSNPLWQHYLTTVLILRDELTNKQKKYLKHKQNKKKSQKENYPDNFTYLQVSTTWSENHFFLLPSLLDSFPFSTIIRFRHPKLCIFHHCYEIVMREAAENIFNRLILNLILPAQWRTGCEVVNVQQESCKYHSMPGRQKHNFLPWLFFPLSFVYLPIGVFKKKRPQ